MCNHIEEINGENDINNIPANKLKNKQKNKHFFTILVTLENSPRAISSDTILIHAKFIPDIARVVTKIYIAITNWYTPTASVPILLEIYTLKNIPIDCNNREVKVSIIPLYKKNLIFLKVIHLLKYMRII